MKSGGGWELVSQLYDIMHIALWSLLIAFIIFFCVFTLPRMPQLAAEMQAKRILEIAAENRSYCEKLGIVPGSRKYAACIMDLDELRAKIYQRASDEPFP